jgi:hypothetical protein
MSLTPQDLQQIRTAVEAVTEPSFAAIKMDLEALRTDFGGLTTSVDEFLRIVRRHEEEWLVLRAQHVKMRELLIKKGVATEEELAIS